jgi:hypothetical protein
LLKYNNTNIFTGYLKQMLSSFNLPACKVYTHEYAAYYAKHGEEDPRVLESFDNVENERAAVRINYLKNTEIYNYFCRYSKNKQPKLGLDSATWRRSSNLYYDSEKRVPGLTRNLSSTGIYYDTKTHEYLGDYLRFLRDYHNINLMSMYNCFNDKIFNNIYCSFILKEKDKNSEKDKDMRIVFNSQDPKYKIYAIPVKLFANYTIAIDCDQGIELFCGLYNTNLDTSSKAEKLAKRTYQKVHKTLFRQPFLYDKLDVKHWSAESDFEYNLDNDAEVLGIRKDTYTRWDITNREKDLRLFIKVPVSCKSSVTILEGDFRYFNDAHYTVDNGIWEYQNNRSVLNFNTADKLRTHGDGIDLNNYAFKPISQLQLLAFNTGESYPFADRLIEYLSGSAITPIDEIPDNIKRVQRVMNKNSQYFDIEGIWENKMQNTLYDYIMNSGPIEADKTTGKLVDKHQGYHRRLGHASKSKLFDVIGYADKDVEKWYASWKKDNNVAKVGTSLHSVDIYDGLYDIK